jgi:hypothetical protein
MSEIIQTLRQTRTDVRDHLRAQAVALGVPAENIEIGSRSAEVAVVLPALWLFFEPDMQKSTERGYGNFNIAKCTIRCFAPADIDAHTAELEAVELAERVAIVMQSAPQVHGNVAELDFIALYSNTAIADAVFFCYYSSSNLYV